MNVLLSYLFCHHESKFEFRWRESVKPSHLKAGMKATQSIIFCVNIKNILQNISTSQTLLFANKINHLISEDNFRTHTVTKKGS